jgi:Fe-S cluster biosynthesis and repair protein YggX
MEARIRRDFSAAESAYTDILSNHPDLAAAFWGRALSRYGVEYQPIGDGEYRLVCHKAVMSDFSRDTDVTTAISLSDEAEQESYVQETQKISALQKAVSKYAAVSAPCDVLVIPGAGTGAEKVKSVKTMLGATGCSVFAPAVELTSTPRQDWEPMLSRAFSTAHTMVLIAVGKNAFTPEVQFDAERFLYRSAQQQRNAQAQVSQLVIAFDDLDEYDDIPDTIFDGADVRMPMNVPGFAEELCRLISESGVNYDAALRQEASGHENFEYSNLINNANRVLQSGDFHAAEERFEQILNYNPRESQAYWGLLLTKYKSRDEGELIKLGANVFDESSYKNAVSFASERERQIYEDIAKQAHDKYNQKQKEELEKARIAEEKEEKRALNEQEVANAKVRKAEEEQKKKRRNKRRMKLVIVLMIVAAVAGAIIYNIYSKTAGETGKIYRQEQSHYDSVSYQDAVETIVRM